MKDKSSKLQKNIRLDVDVFNWLLAKSEEKGQGYQIYLNELLIGLMNGKALSELAVLSDALKLTVEKTIVLELERQFSKRVLSE